MAITSSHSFKHRGTLYLFQRASPVYIPYFRELNLVLFCFGFFCWLVCWLFFCTDKARHRHANHHGPHASAVLYASWGFMAVFLGNSYQSVHTLLVFVWKKPYCTLLHQSHLHTVVCCHKGYAMVYNPHYHIDAHQLHKLLKENRKGK